MLRLLRGEEIDVLSRELGVTAATLAQWRERFLLAGQAALKSRPPDGRDEEVRRLQAKIGEVLDGERVDPRALPRAGGGTPF